MNKSFKGPLGHAIQKHLALRRSLGYQLCSEDGVLGRFDEYVQRYFPKARTVTRDMIIGYLQTNPHLRSSTRKNVIGMLRQFCRFLFQQNPNTYIPEKRLVPPAQRSSRPHLYTASEVVSLMQLARQLPPQGSLRSWSFSTLIGLLWVSGLRINEALQLTLRDVDLEKGVLQIRQTKNFKSRIVPLTSSSVAALATYRAERAKRGFDESPPAPFFVNQRGRRFAYPTIQSRFHAMVRQLGLDSVHGRQPRLHDFRHSFATRTLADLYKSGQDPNACLPVLATYLGHVNIACTTVYLHPSIDVLTMAGHRFQTRVQALHHKNGGSHETF
jgi:integrase/recombinase XerD